MGGRAGVRAGTRAGAIAGRVVFGVVAVAVMGVAGWLAWLLPGRPMTAALGFGPPTGTVTIASCYPTRDDEGDQVGTNCTGAYAPRDGGVPYTLTLQDAGRSYPKGTKVPVRMVAGRPTGPSPMLFALWGLLALLMLVVPAMILWLVAREPSPREGSAGGLLPVLVLLALPAFLLLMLVGFVITSLR